MANAQRFPIVSPIGRIVEGDAWTAQEKDANGQLRVIKTGPNAGKPNPQFYIGLAVPKLINGQPNQDFAAFYAFVDQVARAGWPNLFPNGGPCIRQDFAWKIRDGDGFSREGKPLKDKPGFAGHWIISFASSFAPEVVVETSPGVYAAITDKELLKRGYWARVGASISSNESTQTPGLYLNLEKLELKGKGEVIQTGISAAQAFGQAAAGAIPEGMQALTAADLAGAPAGFGGAPAGHGAQPGFPAPGAPAAFPGAAPQPGFPSPGAPVAAGFPQAGAPAAPAIGQSPAAGFAQPATAYPGSPQPGFPAPAAAAGFPNAAPGAVAGAVPGGVQVGAPAVPAAAPAPSAPAYSGFMGAAPVMLPAANGATYEQFIAQGWTEEAMIAQGFMAPRT